MATEVIIFRLIYWGELYDPKNDARKTMIDKVVPKIKASGADFVYFGELLHDTTKIGIIQYGWCDIKNYEKHTRTTSDQFLASDTDLRSIKQGGYPDNLFQDCIKPLSGGISKSKICENDQTWTEVYTLSRKDDPPWKGYVDEVVAAFRRVGMKEPKFTELQKELRRYQSLLDVVRPRISSMTLPWDHFDLATAIRDMEQEAKVNKQNVAEDIPEGNHVAKMFCAHKSA